MMQLSEHHFLVSESCGKVSGLLLRPSEACCLFVFAHGAGAGMEHAFMESAAARLAAYGVATFRYNFPFTEQGRRRPDPRAQLMETVRAAVVFSVGLADDMAGGPPVFAGGKSMGGRMTSMAAAEEPLSGVRGLIFMGFPLHPAGNPGTERAEHLDVVHIPMLFLQGTRDKLAELDLITPICAGLGARAALHVVDGADHGFQVLKRSGRTETEVLDELAAVSSSFCEASGGAKSQYRK